MQLKPHGLMAPPGGHKRLMHIRSTRTHLVPASCDPKCIFDLKHTTVNQAVFLVKQVNVITEEQGPYASPCKPGWLCSLKARKQDMQK